MCTIIGQRMISESRGPMARAASTVLLVSGRSQGASSSRRRGVAGGSCEAHPSQTRLCGLSSGSGGGRPRAECCAADPAPALGAAAVSVGTQRRSRSSTSVADRIRSAGSFAIIDSTRRQKSALSVGTSCRSGGGDSAR